MTAPLPDLAARAAFAAAIATAAGQRLLALRTAARSTSPDVLGDLGDQTADAYLQGCLLGRHPDDGVLSEETADAPERLQRAATWIVDPLDGTNEFKTGRHDFAVHVGLAVGGRAVLGAVALPAIGRTLVAAEGMPVAVHGAGGDWPVALPADAGPPRDRPLRLVVSRSHTPDWVQRCAQELGGAELIPCGSVGFKVAMLLFGRADAYVHKVGLKEWDTCAPEAVARAAGWVVARLDGREHRYNQPDPRCGELLVCRPWLRDRLLAVLAGVAPR